MFNAKKIFFTLAVASFASITTSEADVTGTATNITLDLDQAHYSGEFHLVNSAGDKIVKIHTDISWPMTQGPLEYEGTIPRNQTQDWGTGYDTFSPKDNTYSMYSIAQWRYPDSTTWQFVDDDYDAGIIGPPEN